MAPHSRPSSAAPQLRLVVRLVSAEQRVTIGRLEQSVSAEELRRVDVCYPDMVRGLVATAAA